MTVRQSMLTSPSRVVVAAIVVILVFALLFPFVGGFTETAPTGTTITYALDVSDLPESGLVVSILRRSLHLSVQTFTLTGASGYTTVVEARYLADLESLLGMGFLALFTASLVREE